MPGRTWTLAAAVVAVVLSSGWTIARAWRSRADGRWASCALERGGLALWAVISLLVTVSGRADLWAGALIGLGVVALGLFGGSMRRAGVPGLAHPAALTAWLAVPGMVTALGLLPATRGRVVVTGPAAGHWAPGTLFLVAVVVIALGLVVAFFVQLGASRQSVWSRRSDLDRRGAIILGCAGLSTLALVVPPLRPGVPWVPVVLAVVGVVLDRVLGPLTAPLPATTTAVLDVVSDALAVVGLDGLVIYTNRSAAAVLLPPHPPGAAVRRLDPALGATLTGDGERSVVTGSGLVLQVRTTTVREDGDAVAMILSARDITEMERLRADLVDLAARDALTGLYNRRHLDGQLAGLIADARHRGAPLCLAMIDLDNLKQLNDQFGHQVGDQALVGVTRMLTSTADDATLLVRMGGDEFLVALPGTDAGFAELHAQQWQVGAARLVLGPDVPCVTLSIGVAQLEPGMDAGAFVSAADGMLYAAKAAGRNRVRVRPRGPVTTAGSA